MFFVVPKNKSIIHAIATTESFESARFHVNFMKRSRDEEYDIVEMRRYPFDDVNLPIEPIDTEIDQSLYW